MATTRLRRTFHYPSDSDDPPDLDEEHQETLLQDLETRDQETSTLYRKLFLALPILTTLHSLINPSLRGNHDSTTTALFLTLLQIAVPVLATYILYYHPITVPGRHGLKSLYSFSGKSMVPGTVKPNSRHLIVLGISLSGMLVVMASSKWLSLSTSATPEVTARVRSKNGGWGEIGSLLLPAGMFDLLIHLILS